jgi:hypothetical protein
MNIPIFGRNISTQITVPDAFRRVAAVMVCFLMVFSVPAQVRAASQKGFETPEEGFRTFVSALKAHDVKTLVTCLGEDGKELIYSGDPVSDAHRVEAFVAAYEVAQRMVEDEDRIILVVGETEWPFPIPLVKKGKAWFFDMDQGLEEVLNRRVGENELNTVQALLAVVDAQREYAMVDHDKDGLLAYARKFWSDPGEKNGLYWQTGPDEEPSPLGKFAARAWSKGYDINGSRVSPRPFHGYYFKMLTGQGENAPGGAFDYLVNDKMIGGFAVLAYPAVYGNSGVMTFLVNHTGTVYEKDLGEDTEDRVGTITTFDPD